MSCSLIPSFGQDKQKQIEVTLPDKLHRLYNQEPIRLVYKINTDFNPFYLRGDFDGNKKIDYALAVTESTTGKKGFLIFHTEAKQYFVIGAGKEIPNRRGDDYSMFDAWEVSDERIVEQGVTELKPPKLIGEAILVQKLESSSGLIYWNGNEYRWYQQGD